MRYVGEEQILDILLRFGELTLGDTTDLQRTLAQTTRLYPAIIGKMVQKAARNHPVPRLEGSFKVEEGAPGDLYDAAGATDWYRPMRMVAKIYVHADSHEARLDLSHPTADAIGDSSDFDVISLSSRLSYINLYPHDLFGRVQLYELPEDPPDMTVPENRILIAPWKDAEMLGQAILTLFATAKPPVTKQANSVFETLTPKGRRKLHHAALDGDMTALPKNKRTTRNFDPADREGVTPLMLAAAHGHTDFVERLIGLGASVSVLDARHRTALHHAAEVDDASLIALLVEAGADVEVRDDVGRGALHTAVDNGNGQAARQLAISGANPNAHDDEYGSTPLHLAARRDFAALAPLLVESGASVEEENEAGRSPLHVAAAYGSTSTVQALIESGADVNQRDHNQETPLHRACFFQHTDVIEMLIGAGANVEAADAMGETPLHVAASMNREIAARLLLENGAGIETKNLEGLTPLDIALINVHAPWGSFKDEHNSEVAELLLDAGAAIDPARLPIQDRHVLWPHLTPPSVLMPNGDIDDEKLFLRKNGRAVSVTQHGEFDLPESVAEELKANPQTRGWLQRASLVVTGDNTILHDAIRKDMVRLVERLLDAGASLTPASRGGLPLLHWASRHGKIAVAELLLNRGADLEMPWLLDSDTRQYIKRFGRLVEQGWTPLDKAIETRQVEMAAFLLDRGAVPPETLDWGRLGEVEDAFPITSPFRASHPMVIASSEGNMQGWDALVALFEERGHPLLGQDELKSYSKSFQEKRLREARQKATEKS